MRVSQQLLMESTYRDLNRAAERLLRLQNQVSSGRRVLNASDDPVSTHRILEMRGELSRIDPAQRKSQYVVSWLSLTESSLGRMEDIIARAKELAISQSSATATAQTRQSTGQEVKQLFDEILMIANTRMGDRYVFGGTQTLRAPVSRDEQYRVTFHGNQEGIEVGVGNQRTVRMNVSAVEALERSGLLDTMRGLIEGLEGNDPEAIRSALNGLDRGHEAILALHSEVGARVKAVESNTADLGELRLDLESILSQYQDADMARVITDLLNQQTVYEAALRTTAMITRLNLMEFLPM